MKNTVKRELAGHILNFINDGIIDNDNRDDWHFRLFNEDPYLIGYYECDKWLDRHDLNPFEAIDICLQYEKENFGEITKTYDNSESVVNMLVYIWGEQILSEFEGDTVEELEEHLNEFLNN